MISRTALRGLLASCALFSPAAFATPTCAARPLTLAAGQNVPIQLQVFGASTLVSGENLVFQLDGSNVAFVTNSSVLVKVNGAVNSALTAIASGSNVVISSQSAVSMSGADVI